MAKIGLPKGSGKRLKVREKSVKSQGILKWILSGNPVLLILVMHKLSLKIPSDATLASLSISIYQRWRPRWRTIINGKNCDIENVSNHFLP